MIGANASRSDAVSGKDAQSLVDAGGVSQDKSAPGAFEQSAHCECTTRVCDKKPLPEQGKKSKDLVDKFDSAGPLVASEMIARRMKVVSHSGRYETGAN